MSMDTRPRRLTTLGHNDQLEAIYQRALDTRDAPLLLQWALARWPGEFPLAVAAASGEGE